MLLWFLAMMVLWDPIESSKSLLYDLYDSKKICPYEGSFFGKRHKLHRFALRACLLDFAASAVQSRPRAPLPRTAHGCPKECQLRVSC